MSTTKLFLFIWACHCTGETDDAGDGGTCASSDDTGNFCYVDGFLPDCIAKYSPTASATASAPNRAYSYKICGNTFIIFLCVFFLIS